MADITTVYTPNEVYEYYRLRKCTLCGSDLKTEEQTFKISNEYCGTAHCSLGHSHHYYCGVMWKDPKYIRLETELFEFDLKDKTYKLILNHLSNNSEACIDNVSFGIKSSRFYNIKLTEKSIARRIETVRLLK